MLEVLLVWYGSNDVVVEAEAAGNNDGTPRQALPNLANNLERRQRNPTGLAHEHVPPLKADDGQ